VAFIRRLGLYIGFVFNLNEEPFNTAQVVNAERFKMLAWTFSAELMAWKIYVPTASNFAQLCQAVS
jgi:hypothetical protein